MVRGPGRQSNAGSSRTAPGRAAATIHPIPETMKSTQDRYALLRQAFCEVPSQVGPYKLRPISGGSFELLGQIGNQLVTGAVDGTQMGLPALTAAVNEYIWIHSAPLDEVIAVRTRDDVPADAVRRMAMEIEIGEILAFTTTFTAAAVAMAAALAESDEDDDEPGKPDASPTGSLPSSSPVGPPATPYASGISSGSPPSPEPLPISTPPTSPPEDDADGCTPSMTLPTPDAIPRG